MSHAKTFGLIGALMAALTVGAAAPTAASALEFHTSLPGASLSGTQVTTNVLTIQGEEVSCETMTLSGTAPAFSFTVMELEPAYGECVALGFAITPIEMDGCKFKTHSSGTVDLVCPTGRAMTIKISIPFIAKCYIDVPPQSGVTNLKYVNSRGQQVLSLVFALLNLRYNVTESTGVCPLSVGEGTGSYSGEDALQANGGSAELWIE